MRKEDSSLSQSSYKALNIAVRVFSKTLGIGWPTLKIEAEWWRILNSQGCGEKLRITKKNSSSIVEILLHDSPNENDFFKCSCCAKTQEKGYLHF